MHKYVQFNFSEDWHNYHYGVDFNEDFWTDPIKRTEAYREMSYLRAKTFPDTELGSLEPKPNPVASEQYGHRFISALFGCKIVYTKTQAPSAEPKNADFDEMAALDIPDLKNNDVFRKALDDAKRMKEKYGFASGYINTGSPLNSAISIYGENFLACCALEPEIAQHVLKIITKTYFRLMYEYSGIVSPSSKIDHQWGDLGNCPAVMFSPEMYKNVILPADLWYRGYFKSFSIHHCGVFDNYAELYTSLSPTSLDVGGGSDYKLLRKHFPDTVCSYIVNPEFYEGKSKEEIDALVRNIVINGGPTDKISILRTYGVSRNATNDNVMDLYSSIERQGFCGETKIQ